MTYYVTFYPGRAGLSEYQYDVYMDGEQVASAKTTAAGAIVGEEVEARMGLLGNVPAGGGIIDELRQCDVALRRQGW